MDDREFWLEFRRHLQAQADLESDRLKREALLGQVKAIEARFGLKVRRRDRQRIDRPATGRYSDQ